MSDQAVSSNALLLAFGTGLAVGVVFSLVKLPSPAPPLDVYKRQLRRKGVRRYVRFPPPDQHSDDAKVADGVDDKRRGYSERTDDRSRQRGSNRST